MAVYIMSCTVGYPCSWLIMIQIVWLEASTAK